MLGRENMESKREEEEDEQNGVDATAIALPHAPKTWLPSDVPQFDGDIAFGDFSHIKPNSGDGVVCKITSLLTKHKRERLQSSERKIHE